MVKSQLSAGPPIAPSVTRSPSYRSGGQIEPTHSFKKALAHYIKEKEVDGVYSLKRHAEV